MHIEAVEFVDFRNYRALLFAPTPNLNILAGPNAQGKTNLLEGLAVLLVGRSFRRAKAIEMARWGAMRGSVSGELRREDAPRRLRRVLGPREDGVWTVTGEGCSWARAIPFGWTDLAVVSGVPQARRDFLDGFVAKVYPSYVGTLQRYRQVISRRNHLLQVTPAVGMVGRLEPWNEQLVETGIEIMKHRQQGVAMLEGEVARLYPDLGGRGAITLEYVSALGAEATPVAFHEEIARRLGDEIRRQQTLVGPHRDDLGVRVNGRDLRTFGSRGQQRLVALTLRLAEVRPVAAAVGSEPVLLLDDALSELDPEVQSRVLDHVARAGQVFLTTADPALRVGGDGRCWEVNEGTVTDAGVAALRGAA